MRHPRRRLRFLSISASNLDEFYMVPRHAGLQGFPANAGVASLSDSDGLTPAQQVARVDALAAEAVTDQQQIWRRNCDALQRKRA